MKINLKATGIELTPAIQDYAEKKIMALDKYLTKSPDTYIARVEIGKTSKHHKEGFIFRAEVHISGGIDVYAAAEAEDLYAAIDIVEAEAARELESVKGRREKLLRRGQRAFKNAILGISKRFKRN